MSTTKNKTPAKRVVPPPGRKLSAAQARELVNYRFSKAFKKLAK